MPTKRAPRSQTTKTVLPVRAWKPPPDIDKPCVALSTAMNQLPGIQTTESCCGHGTEPYRIWFRVTDFAARGLLTLARCTCPRYYDSAFKILLNHGDTPEGQVSFLLEGPVGDLSCPPVRIVRAPDGNRVRVSLRLPTRLKKGADRRTFAKADLLAEILFEHVRGTTPGYNILLETLPRYTRPARRHS